MASACPGPASDFFEQILESLDAGVVVYDGDLRYVFWNAATERLAGFSRRDVLGKTPWDVFGRRTGGFAKVGLSARAALRGGTSTVEEIEYTNPRTGETICADIMHRPLYGEGGEIVGAVATIGDVTARKEVEDALRRREEDFRTLVEAFSQIVWVADTSGEIVDVSHGFADSTGIPPDEAMGKQWLEALHPDDREETAISWEASVANGTAFEREYRVRDRRGGYRHYFARGLPVRGPDGAVTRWIGTSIDIHERKEYEARLERQANYDALTGLATRSLLHSRVEQALAYSRRSERMTEIVFIDVDNFKMVNDTFGHEQGDAVLREVAARLAGSVRMNDTVARMGGDEFVVVITELVSVDDSIVVHEKLRRALAQPFTIGNREFYLTASMGACVYPTDGHDVDTLLRNADAAMYRAKMLHSTSVVFYSSAMDDRARLHLELAADLRHALRENEFVLHYQPVVDLRTGRVGGAEALLRWQRSNKLLYPADFMDVAEETRLIVPIGDWVIRAACLQAQQWRERGLALSVAVNVSAAQLYRGSLATTVAETLQATQLPPSALELELTETVLIRDPDAAIDVVRDLQALGVSITLDDFGTGYSSLSYAKRFPIDALKIDRTFVRDIPVDTDDAAITRTIIAMGHSLQMRVVAEGVETREQLEFLLDEGCDAFQGYYFSPPVPAAEFPALAERPATFCQGVSGTES